MRSILGPLKLPVILMNLIMSNMAKLFTVFLTMGWIAFTFLSAHIFVFMAIRAFRDLQDLSHPCYGV
jgi:hypothetical protein